MSSYSRRQLIKLAACCGGAWALRPLLQPSLLLAEGACGNGPGKVLINVVLNGGFDGLFAFQPLASDLRSALSARRAPLMLPTSADPGQLSTVSFGHDLFGVHSNLAQQSGDDFSIRELLQKGEAKLIGCVGMPVDSRSHPDAMVNLMSGMARYDSSTSGQWLARLMDRCGMTATQVFKLGSAPGLPLQRTQGQPPIRIERSLQQYDWVSADNQDAADTLQQLLEAQENLSPRKQSVRSALLETLDSIPVMRPIQAVSLSGSYSADGWSGFFQDAARIVKHEFRPGNTPRTLFLQIGLDGFDHHENLRAGLGAALASINRNIGALRTDLVGPAWQRTLLMVSSEFGRSFFGGWGSEHGHGNMTIIAGGGLTGGSPLIGRAPTVAELSAPDPNPGQGAFAALPVAVDYRQLYAEALEWIGVNTIGVFPGFVRSSTRILPLAGV